MHGQEPGHAFDHHAPHLRDRLADEGDAVRDPARMRRSQRLGLHPFRAGARLARAAAAEQQPRVPGFAGFGCQRRNLVGTRPVAPVEEEARKRIVGLGRDCGLQASRIPG